MSLMPHAPAIGELLWRALHEEHERMNAVLEDVLALVERGSYASAARRFGSFRLCQERHLRDEESLWGLLPDAAKAAWGALRLDHARIVQLLGDVSQAISQWDRVAFKRALDALRALLVAHHVREQRRWVAELGHLPPEEVPWVEEQVARLGRP